LVTIAAALPVAQWLVAHFEAYGGGSALVGGAQQAGFAHAFDLWWPLAHISRHLAAGSPPTWIADWTPPPFLAGHAHELIVLASVPLAAIVVWRRGWHPPAEACLALLALLFLIRCVLDPQNLFYYHLPFVVALIAWEGYGRRRMPWLSITTLVLLYVVFEQVGAGNAHTWADFVAYMAVALPLGSYLLRQLMASPTSRRVMVARPSVAAAHS
jgi:hypothetical protein